MSAAQEWITDRLPTAADADEDGDVTVQNRPKAEPSAGSYFNWSMVRPGMAWTHTDIWEQENEPVPAPKPALAVGQRWRRRNGAVVTITEHDVRNEADYPFCADAHWYRADGTSCIDDSDADLVELIEPAAEPTKPVPAPKPALRVGQRWRRRDGEVVTVNRYDINHLYGETHPFWAGCVSYTADGIYRSTGVAGSDRDLVELIEPGPPQCSTCRFARAITSTADPLLQCRCNPPQIGPRWPSVADTDWCGAYQRAS